VRQLSIIYYLFQGYAKIHKYSIKKYDVVISFSYDCKSKCQSEVKPRVFNKIAISVNPNKANQSKFFKQYENQTELKRASEQQQQQQHQ